MSTNIDLIQQGVDLMFATGKISTSVASDLNTYIAAITDMKARKYLYPQFDQDNSIAVTFDDEAQTASGGTNFELVTLPIVLTSVILLAVKVVATIAELTIQISDDGGATFFTIPDDRIFINQTSTSFILKFKKATASVISGFYILYQ